MSKRNKKLGSKRSALKLEALEQRQLLATIIGSGGVEVAGGTDVLVDGKVYDQILMTGSSVSVQADPGQIVRVDFLDKGGDLVRAEFSGSGTMTVSLSDFVAAATPTKYVTTTQYVSGLASINISGSSASTNLLITSLGPVTANGGLANPIFGADGSKTGDNNIADIARVVISSDASSPIGSEFGSIFAGNAVFSDTVGTVGIVAPNIQFKGAIRIGDIEMKGTSTGVVQIGQFSDNKTLTVAGGDLVEASGATNGSILMGNISTILSTTGTTSKSTASQLETKVIAAGDVNNFNSGNTVAVAPTLTYSSGLGSITIDGSTVTQATLDTYKSKFLGDVTITGGLASGLIFRALQFGNVTVNGDLAGTITTDADDDNVSDANEQGIGAVTINGSVVNGGYVESSTAIGNITVSGKVTHTTVASNVLVSGAPKIIAEGVFTTIGRTSSPAAIGNVSFGDAVSITSAESLLTASTVTGPSTGGIGTITGTDITVNSGAATRSAIGSGSTASGHNIGAITLTGSLSLTNTDGTNAGIQSGRAIGAISAKAITLNEATDAIKASNGNIGAISTTNGAFVQTAGEIEASGSIGAITVTGGNYTITAGGLKGTNVGNIKLTAGDLTVGAAISATTGNVGSITVDSGNIAINAAIGAGTDGGATLGNVGAITATKGDITVAAAVSARVSIGNITVSDGNLNMNAGGTFKAINGTDWAGTSIGNVSVTAGTTNTAKGRIVGVDATIDFQANKIGNVTVTGGSATTGALLTDVIFSAKGTTAATVGSASIGNISLDSSARDADGIIATSANVATDADSGNGFSSSGNIGNITVKTGSGATTKIIDNNTTSLFFRAGSSEHGASTTTTAGGAAVTADVANVSIGTVTITGKLGNVSSGGNAAGTGLVIASGVDVIAGGVFANAAQNAAVAVGAKVTSGSIGAVTLNDVSGTTTRTAFNTSVLTENNTAALTAAPVIIGDNIASIKVNTGVELVNITPTGLALKGAIGTGLSSTAQTFAGNDANKIFIVII